MTDCTCNGQCKPDSISFMWMHDNHTFVQLKSKNLQEVVKHARRIRKKSKYGMLCPATLLRGERDFRRIGQCVHDNDKFEDKLLQWVDAIMNDNFAPTLIAEGKISK